MPTLTRSGAAAGRDSERPQVLSVVFSSSAFTAALLSVWQRGLPLVACLFPGQWRLRLLSHFSEVGVSRFQFVCKLLSEFFVPLRVLRRISRPHEGRMFGVCWVPWRYFLSVSSVCLSLSIFRLAGPVGLHNIGQTCCLNSLIQVLVRNMGFAKILKR